MDDLAVEMLQRVADTLRGMWLDPRIPADARAVLRKQADDLQALLDSASDDDEAEP